MLPLMLALLAGPMVLDGPDLRQLSVGPMVMGGSDGTTCTGTRCSDGRVITTVRASTAPCETAPGGVAAADTACVTDIGTESFRHIALPRSAVGAPAIADGAFDSPLGMGTGTRITDNSTTSAEGVHYEAAVTEGGDYGVSCLMRADTATSARLSVTTNGTGTLICGTYTGMTAVWTERTCYSAVGGSPTYVRGQVVVGNVSTTTGSIGIAGCEVLIPGRPSRKAPDRHTVDSGLLPTGKGFIAATVRLADASSVDRRVVLDSGAAAGRGVSLQIAASTGRLVLDVRDGAGKTTALESSDLVWVARADYRVGVEFDGPTIRLVRNGRIVAETETAPARVLAHGSRVAIGSALDGAGQIDGWVVSLSAGARGRVGSAPLRPLYIIAGQSNAAGRGAASDLSVDLRADYPPVRYAASRDGGGVAVETPWGALRKAPDGSIGPEIGFGRHLGAGIGIVKCAEGGTGLAVHWLAGGLYDACAATIRDLLAQTDVYRVEGVVWVQGEADATNAANAVAYEANLTTLIGLFRRDFGADARFALNTLHNGIPMETCPYADTVRAAQLSVSSKTPGVVAVDPSAYELKTDLLHYNGRGQYDLGVALAVAMQGVRP